MAKAKVTSTIKIEARSKKTKQGQGKNSVPNHGRKKMRGQGR
jgi:hypothetical protein